MSANVQQRPDFEVHAGSIFAAVWTKPLNTRYGERPTHSIRFHKRYRDKQSGVWKSTTYLRPDDIPKLVLLASRVYEYIHLKTGASVK